MAGIGNNLYPPIIATYMPAFLRVSSCKVYFSISAYNSLAEIQNVQIMVSNQNSSLSALDETKYPAGIKLENTIYTDPDVARDAKYYIEISPSDMEDGIFEIGQYYKVQLRFTSTEAASPPSSGGIAGWLVDNEAYFSEWSTVCLIRGIATPIVYIKGFENVNSNEIVTLTTEVAHIVGGLYYTGTDALTEDEYLKSYIINIYDSSQTSLLYTTGIVYTNEFYPNEINYTLRYNLEDGVGYTIEIEYTTNNGYESSIAHSFTVQASGFDTLEATISADCDAENGRIAVHVASTDSHLFFGNLCIRRSSSKTNFTIWDDVKIDTITGVVLDYTWYDYTVESGIYYKYCACQINNLGERGPIVSIRYPIMLYLDDIFLTRGDFQLKVKYNPQISSFKLNLSESLTNTIGSKYPYIRRNGNVAYRTFPISGTITAFCDSDHLFTSREGFYGEVLDYYDNFNTEEQITEYKDFIYEKFFRDKVMDFLHENTVKLYRSLTEGNILVKLMDISFTPNQTLGRMIYDFSATAYEIDECSVENYGLYGVCDIGEYSSYIEYEHSVIGQIGGDTISANTNVITLIQEEANLAANEGYVATVNYLTWVRLEFQSAPYLIQSGANGSLIPLPADQEPDENTVSGYIVYINGEAILVSARGYLEYKDDGTQIVSITFPVDTDVLIDYEADIVEGQNKSTTPSKMTYTTVAGQLWGEFDVDESISKDIYIKYREDYDSYYQLLLSIDSITIEADIGTIVYVKDSFDDDYYRHEIGHTGVLSFYDSEAVISALYFSGVHLVEMPQDSEYPRDYEFERTGIVVNTVDEIESPLKNGVYTINDYTPTKLYYNAEGHYSDPSVEQYLKALQERVDASNNQYIYYRNEWYQFTSDNEVLCPAQGLIDYICEVVKGDYET